MFKTIMKVLIALVITFGSLLIPNLNGHAADFTHKPGDILYTKSTQCKDDDRDVCKGITGHVGIVYDSKTVVHIAAPGTKPSTLSVNDWYSTYNKTKVIRPNNSSDGQKAAKWAYDYYIKGEGKNNSYHITKAGRKDKLNDYTYCSQIVWQGYYYGANKALIIGEPANPATFETMATENAMKVVRTVGSW